MSDTVLCYEVTDRAAVLTMNRPAQRNALNSELGKALTEGLLRAEQDPGVAVIVVTGADPAFSAGLDIKEFRSTGRPPTGVNDAIRTAGILAKPTIGAINGAVYTGGLELALGFDFLIASERATFGDTHGKVGILPGGGMSARLPRAVGDRMARELSYTGRTFDSAEALRIGLVNRVVSHESLLATTLAVAAEIATQDDATVRELKNLYVRSAMTDGGTALEHEYAERDRRRIAGGQLVPRSLDEL